MQREEFHIETTASYTSPRTNHSDEVGNDRAKLTNGFSSWNTNCALSKLCIGLLIVIVFAVIFICVAFVIAYENEEQLVVSIEMHTEHLPPEQAIWFETNLEELRNAFRVTKNNRRARNVVLLIALESEKPSNADQPPIWEFFPHLALLRASQDRITPFNPTALFSGIETQPGTIGLDSSVRPSSECISTAREKHDAGSIVEWAQAIGRRTAVVTNGEIVQTFSAALYAHTSNESWMYNTPGSQLDCKSIQTQLLLGDTGKQLNVIAGSLNCDYPSCKELFQTAWLNQKMSDHVKYKLSTRVSDFLSSEDDWEYILGLYDRQPLERKGSFHDITVGALHAIDSPEGFLLIAIADPRVMISPEELDSTVRSTLQKLGDSLEDTLIVVVRSAPRDRAKFATVHATGPMSHLLHRVHNQTYLAHFISYATRIGRFRDSDLSNFVLQMF